MSSPSGPTSVADTTITQWNINASSTKNNITGDRVSHWVTSQYTINGGDKVAPSISHHIDPDPVIPEKPERPGAQTLCIQDLNTLVLIQGVIHLIEVQKLFLEDRLPHGHKMLYKIGLKGGCTYPMSRSKPIKYIA